MMFVGRVALVLSVWLLAPLARADIPTDPRPPASDPGPREPVRESGCAGRLAAGSPGGAPLALVMMAVGVAALIGRERRSRALS
jgi:hypothetical protein